MKEIISSSMSFFYKFIFSSIWIIGFGFGAIISLLNFSFIPVIVFILGTLFIYYYCIRLKKVSIDKEYLYISNYSTEIKIPISEIEKITEDMFININPIWIHFKNPIEFGNYIIFIPKIRLLLPFTSHPIVNELREKIERTY